jgi:hypothetical protein
LLEKSFNDPNFAYGVVNSAILNIFTKPKPTKPFYNTFKYSISGVDPFKGNFNLKDNL